MKNSAKAAWNKIKKDNWKIQNIVKENNFFTVYLIFLQQHEANAVIDLFG